MNLQQTLSLIAIGLAAVKASGKLDPTILGFIETADNAIKFVDENHFQYLSRDREIGGSPLPDLDMKFTRKAAKR